MTRRELTARFVARRAMQALRALARVARLMTGSGGEPTAADHEVVPTMAAFAGSFALGGAPAQGITIGFECLTGNDAGDCAIGENQFTVDVTDQGGGVVRFHFKNSGPAASTKYERSAMICHQFDV